MPAFEVGEGWVGHGSCSFYLQCRAAFVSGWDQAGAAEEDERGTSHLAPAESVLPHLKRSVSQPADMWPADEPCPVTAGVYRPAALIRSCWLVLPSVGISNHADVL
jgi:hypothetical protein